MTKWNQPTNGVLGDFFDVGPAPQDGTRTSHGQRWRSLRRLQFATVCLNSRRAPDSRLPAVCAVSESAAAAAPRNRRPRRRRRRRRRQARGDRRPYPAAPPRPPSPPPPSPPPASRRRAIRPRRRRYATSGGASRRRATGTRSSATWMIKPRLTTTTLAIQDHQGGTRYDQHRGGRKAFLRLPKRRHNVQDRAAPGHWVDFFGSAGSPTRRKGRPSAASGRSTRGRSRKRAAVKVGRVHRACNSGPS